MILCDFHVSVHLADKVWQYSVWQYEYGSKYGNMSFSMDAEAHIKIIWAKMDDECVQVPKFL